MSGPAGGKAASQTRSRSKNASSSGTEASGSGRPAGTPPGSSGPTVSRSWSARIRGRSAGPSQALRPTMVATVVGEVITRAPSGGVPCQAGGTISQVCPAVPVARRPM